MMGTGVGLTIGFIFGSFTILRCVLFLILVRYRVFKHDIGVVLAQEGRCQHSPSTCSPVQQHLVSSSPLVRYAFCRHPCLLFYSMSWLLMPVLVSSHPFCCQPCWRSGKFSFSEPTVELTWRLLIYRCGHAIPDVETEQLRIITCDAQVPRYRPCSLLQHYNRCYHTQKMKMEELIIAVLKKLRRHRRRYQFSIC